MGLALYGSLAVCCPPLPFSLYLLKCSVTKSDGGTAGDTFPRVGCLITRKNSKIEE